YGLPLRLSRPRSLWPFAHISRKTLERGGVVTADMFFAPPWGEPTQGPLMDRIASLPQGVTEVALHPVEDGAELHAYDTEYAELRVADAACLLDARLRDQIESRGARLIGFRPLREAMRRGT
ncbi:MAG: hypothetical protein ACREHV_07335, partial [Rhizomicrobium sp.]